MRSSYQRAHLKEGTQMRGDQPKICQLCEEDQVVAFCGTCVKYICQFCQMSHKRQTATKKHAVDIISCQQTSSGQPIEDISDIRCLHHTQSRVNSLCKTCNAVVCSQCMDDVKHYNHSFVNLAIALQDLQSANLQQIQALQKSCTNVKSLVLQQSNAEKSVNNDCKDAIDEIEKSKNDSINYIQQKSRQSVRAVYKVKDNYKKEFNTIEIEAAKLLSSSDSLFQSKISTFTGSNLADLICNLQIIEQNVNQASVVSRRLATQLTQSGTMTRGTRRTLSQAWVTASEELFDYSHYSPKTGFSQAGRANKTSPSANMYSRRRSNSAALAVLGKPTIVRIKSKAINTTVSSAKTQRTNTNYRSIVYSQDDCFTLQSRKRYNDPRERKLSV